MSNDLNSLIIEGRVEGSANRIGRTWQFSLRTTREFKDTEAPAELETESFPLMASVTTPQAIRQLEAIGPQIEGTRVRIVGRLAADFVSLYMVAEHIELITPNAHRHDQAEAARVSDEVRSE